MRWQPEQVNWRIETGFCVALHCCGPGPNAIELWILAEGACVISANPGNRRLWRYPAARAVRSSMAPQASMTPPAQRSSQVRMPARRIRGIRLDPVSA